MTTICAITKGGRCYIAGDRMVSTETTYFAGETKIVKVGNVAVGVAGEFSYLRWVRERLPPRWFEDIDDFCADLREFSQERGHEEIRAELLICFPDGLYLVDCEGSHVRVERGWFAIGSGAAEAMGAICLGVADEGSDPRWLVEAAVSVASQLDRATGCGVDVMELSDDV